MYRVNSLGHPTLITQFEQDIWEINRISLSADRSSPSLINPQIHFEKIENETNKVLVKEYMEYLLLGTGLSYSTITGSFYHICRIIKIINKCIIDWTEPDTEYLKQYCTSHYLSEYRNSIFHTFNNFISFLQVERHLCLIPLIDYQSSAKYNIKESAPPKEVVDQIFASMKNFTDWDCAIVIMILYATGLRISEICSLNRDCLFLREDTAYIYSYNSKMKKEVLNNIPINLYETIADKRDSLSGTKWLFPNPKNKDYPVNPSQIRVRIKKELAKCNIQNPDGSTYVFKAHSFRHLMAVRMAECGIRLSYIQEQLHHSSPEMTLVYVEFTGKRLKSKAEAFYKNSDSIPTPIRQQKTPTAKILPFGLCGRPGALPKCKYANACLFCNDFFTNIEFEEELKCQRNRVDHQIDYYLKNNLENELSTAVNLKERLDYHLQKIHERELNE